MSEAAVNGTIIGSAVTGQDAVTSRQLSGAERALAGVEVGLEFVSVGGSALRATTQSARVARAAGIAVNAAQTAQAGLGVYRGGSATAELLREGRYGAAALTGLLTAAGGVGGYQSAKALRGSSRAAADLADDAASFGDNALRSSAGEGGLPATGVERYDALVAGTQTYERWVKNVEGRGFKVVDDITHPTGTAAQIMRTKSGPTVMIDKNQFRYVDLLHESRHIAQIQRAARKGVDVFQNTRRLGLMEKGAYEFEKRLGQRAGFSQNYMDFVEGRINDYWSRSLRNKFLRSPSFQQEVRDLWH